jgi:hypothetical protein
MAYAVLFNNVYEAQNLLLVIFTYVAEVQLPGNAIPLIWQKLCLGCPLVISITSCTCKVQMLYASSSC